MWPVWHGGEAESWTCLRDRTGHAAQRGRILGSICEAIGDTPLVRLNRLPAEAGCLAEVLVKLEFFNPLSSVKDRIALAMVEAAERAGQLGPPTA